MRAKAVGALIGACVSLMPAAVSASPGGDGNGPVETTCFSTSIITSQIGQTPSQICMPSDINETIRRNRSRNTGFQWWRFGIKPGLFIVVAIVVQISRLAKRKRRQPDFRGFVPQPQAQPAPPPAPPFGHAPLSQPAPPPPPPPVTTTSDVMQSWGGPNTALPPPPPPPGESGTSPPLR